MPMWKITFADGYQDVRNTKDMLDVVFEWDHSDASCTPIFVEPAVGDTAYTD